MTDKCKNDDSDICRICLSIGTYKNIFRKINSSTISDLLNTLSGIQIQTSDGLPDKICLICLKKLKNCTKFIKLIKESDLKLRQTLLIKIKKENGFDTPLENLCNIQENSNETSIENTLDLEFQKDVNKIKLKKRLSTERNNKTARNVSKQKMTLKDRQCQVCGRITSCRARLEVHMRIHTGERPYTCEHCGKRFTLEQTLKIHMRTHTGEKPLSCPVCGKTFGSGSGLFYHKLKHAESDKLPYKCTQCPKTFKTIGHLRYHVSCHSGEKNFVCDSCGRAFTSRSNLTQHIKSYTCLPSHFCSVCGTGFPTYTRLRRHLTAMHKGHKTYSCEVCHSAFAQKKSLLKHSKKHSPKKCENDGR